MAALCRALSAGGGQSGDRKALLKQVA